MKCYKNIAPITISMFGEEYGKMNIGHQYLPVKRQK